MNDSEKESKTNSSPKLLSKRNSCLIAAVVALIAVAAVIAFTVFKTLDTVEKIVSGFQEPFLESNIQETFQSTAFKSKGNQGGILEVATATTTETFKRKSEFSLFDHTLPLGATVSEIQVPATYRYHIDLKSSWQISAQQNKCVVIAPELLPSLPVAFDTGEMKSKTANGWARWDKHENLKKLEQSLTKKLAEHAVLPENIDLVRDEARLSIARFVKSWLLNHEHWDNERFTEIIVLFPDELEKNAPLPPPTLRLKQATQNSLSKPAL